MTWLIKVKIILLAIVTLGGSIAVAKYKNIKRENEKLNSENDELRQQKLNADARVKATQNYAEARLIEEAKKAERAKALEKIVNEDENLNRIVSEQLPDELRDYQI